MKTQNALTPPPSRCRRALLPLGVLCFLLTTGCVSTNLTPISVSGASYQPLPDEIDLWDESRDAEIELRSAGAVIHDPGLENYLQQLVDRLQSPGMAANREIQLRVAVLDDPSLNAFSYPHGTIFIHSGLLERVESEDQLAAVLAHEIAHVENRHMARHERAKWNRAMPIAVASFGMSLALAVEEVDALEDGNYYEAACLDEMSEDILDLGFELATRVTARGYGRKLEREADHAMLSKLRQHGYDLDDVQAFYDGLEGVAANPEALAHGLGPDVARRLRTLAKSTQGPAEVTRSPILGAADLQQLVSEVRSPTAR